MGEKRVIEQVASNEVHIDDWFLKDSPTQGTSKISATNLKAILGADGTLALEEIANAIAEEYDSTHTYYNTGLVFHEGVLYQCTATSVTGTWDSTKWNVVDIKDLLDNVSTNIGYLWNTISNTIAGIYDTSSTYNTGDYAIYSLKLYRCKDDDVTGAWNSSKWEEVNIPEYIDYVLVNAGKVDDVKVDGTSVVTNKVAEIEIPVKDVQVKIDSTYDSVVDASGNAKIDLSSVTAYGEVSNLPQPIASFSDGAVAPMMGLKVAIEPQQEGSGDPSPTNIRPISGWSEANVNVSGVNVWDEEWEVGGINHTTGQNTETAGIIRSKNYIMIKGNTNYNFLKKTNGIDFHVHWYDADKNFISYEEVYTNSSINYKVATSPQNAVYMRFNLTAGYGATYNNDISINYPSTDTDYHAYNGNTYTIDLDGTRYGGTLDVVSGVLTVDRVGVDIGSMTYGEYGSTSDCTQYYTTALDTLAKSNSQVISDIFVYGETVMPWTMRITSGEQGRTYFRTTKDLYESPSAFKTAMNGHQLVYELATPITIQLTPTAVKSLLGSNNVWADTGDINECVYRRDMSSTIDDIIARIEALEG